jgi:CBS domain-containing protein
MSMLVRHAMATDPQTARPDMTAADAAGLMARLDVGVIPIAEGDQLLGLVTDRDLVVRVLADRRDPTEVKLGEILTRSPVTVTPDMQVSHARDLMAEHQIRRLPVVKAEKLVGIISMGDIAFADASKRAVGETLQQVSESPSTTDLADTPERGTPDRVMEARESRD